MDKELWDDLPIIIGLCGPKNAGKTTIANGLKNAIKNTTILPFAHPIKLMLAFGLGLPETAMTDPDLKERIIPVYKKTPRYLMQTLGTDWGRNMVDKNIWANAWKNAVLRGKYGPGDVVIADDVRFVEEAEAIKEMGGVIVRIVRANTAYTLEHESETGEFIECDFHLHNYIRKKQDNYNAALLELFNKILKHTHLRRLMDDDGKPTDDTGTY